MKLDVSDILIIHRASLWEFLAISNNSLSTPQSPLPATGLQQFFDRHLADFQNNWIAMKLDVFDHFTIPRVCFPKKIQISEKLSSPSQLTGPQKFFPKSDPRAV